MRDAGRREALTAAGLQKARAVAITFTDTAIAIKILHHVQHARPELPVIVRTFDDTELDRLLKAGAAEVVPGSARRQPDARVAFAAAAGRAAQPRAGANPGGARGALQHLPRFFHGATDAADAEDNLQPRLHSVLLSERSTAVGKSLAELNLEGRVEVNSVRRRGARAAAPSPDFRFEAGDVRGAAGQTRRSGVRRAAFASRLTRLHGLALRAHVVVAFAANGLQSTSFPGFSTSPMPVAATADSHATLSPTRRLDPAAAAIELADVSFAYDTRPILRGITMTVPRGKSSRSWVRADPEDDDPAPDRRPAEA